MKKEIDMLHGSLWDKILLFALPLAATGVLQQLFNAADIAIVGNFTGDKGTACMAAVGANTPIIGLIVNTVVAISLGTNVVVAHSIGTGDDETVSRAVHNSVIFALLAGIAIAVIGEILAPQILFSQNVPNDVLPFAVKYLRIYFLGLPVILLYNFEAAVYRGVGDTRTPLIILTISGVINVFLNIAFVLGFGMDVEGVAIATVVSNLISCAFLFIKLMKNDKSIRIDLKKLKINWDVLKRILYIGVPTGAQNVAFCIANLIIQASINTLGITVMAASSAAFNIEIFCFCVMSSFAQACTTFVGQNNGAGNMERCRKILGICFLETVIAQAASLALIYFFGRNFLTLFTQDPAVIEVGYSRLLIILMAYILSMVYENMAGYLRGFEISVLPAILTIIAICGSRITWIYLVFPVHHTFEVIMAAYPLSFLTADIMVGIALLVKRPSQRNNKVLQVEKQ